MRTVAVIPARAGSKRLPGKNVRLLGGKPLIVWSIDAAFAAGIDDVIVSTDGEDIAKVSRDAGAKVVMRPADLASDQAETLPVIRHAVSTVQADTVVLLQPTSPLRAVGDIVECVKLHHASGRPVVSVEAASPWLFWRDGEGNIAKVVGEKDATAVQPNGAVYVVSAEGLHTDSAWWDNPLTLLMPQDRSIDIDTLTDFLAAEALLARQGY